MLEATESAIQHITEQLKSREVSVIRVFLNHCEPEPRLELGLDEPNDNDEVYDISGFKYVVDKELMKEAKNIKIDCVSGSITITSSMIVK